MDAKLRAKAILILLLIVLTGMILVPTFAGEENQSVLPGWFTKVFSRRMKLGLDLKGGMHLVLGVEVDKAVSDKVDRTVDDLKEEFRSEGVAFESVKAASEGFAIETVFSSDADMAKAKDKVIDKDYRLEIEKEDAGEKKLVIGFEETSLNQTRENAVDQAIKTIRNRVDQFGVVEPDIKKRGKDSILVQLPGIDDPERAKGLLGKTAQLEFKIVDDESDFLKNIENLPEGVKKDYYQYAGQNDQRVVEAYLISKDRAKIEEFLKDKIPEGHEIVYGKETINLEEFYRTFIIFKKTAITGDYLTDARVAIDRERSQPYVSLRFDMAGARIFERITGENVRKRMAIVLDGVVDSAPVIQEKIPGGNAQITLGSMRSYEDLLKEANDLAIVLRAGALPAPVRILEERTVGPSLGRDSIRKGLLATGIGSALVIVFMIIYYSMSGVFAVVALVLNIALILAAMAMFQSTMTLPGIAGIALTIGMAVDANVIIFERIREELRAGKTVRYAVENGYGRAFWTIFDSNITTLLAGVILFQYGTGPIKGFAVTLSIGLLSSMFTAIFVTRVLQDWAVNLAKGERILIG